MSDGAMCHKEKNKGKLTDPKRKKKKGLEGEEELFQTGMVWEGLSEGWSVGVTSLTLTPSGK